MNDSSRQQVLNRAKARDWRQMAGALRKGVERCGGSWPVTGNLAVIKHFYQ